MSNQMGAEARKAQMFERAAEGAKGNEGSLRQLLEEARAAQAQAEMACKGAQEALEPLRTELEELRLSKKKAYTKMAGLKVQLDEVKRVSESAWTQQLLSSVGTLRIGVFAPSVVVDIQSRGPPKPESLSARPNGEIERFLSDELLPREWGVSL